MCGGHKSTCAIVDIATSHHTQQSPSEACEIQPKLKVHYAGPMANSNACSTENWYQLRGSNHMAFQAALEENRRALHLGLPKIFSEVLSVVAAEQFFSGHQWPLFLELFQEHL